MLDTKRSRQKNLRTFKIPCISLITHFLITEIKRGLNIYYVLTEKGNTSLLQSFKYVVL